MKPELTHPSRHEFLALVGEALAHLPSFRRGQVVFDVATLVNADLAAAIAGTDDDCYSDDSRIDAFLDKFLGDRNA